MRQNEYFKRAIDEISMQLNESYKRCAGAAGEGNDKRRLASEFLAEQLSILNNERSTLINDLQNMK